MVSYAYVVFAVFGCHGDLSNCSAIYCDQHVSRDSNIIYSDTSSFTAGPYTTVYQHFTHMLIAMRRWQCCVRDGGNVNRFFMDSLNCCKHV